MQDGKTKVESREKVISNIATEERNTAFNIIPTPTAGILLSQVRYIRSQFKSWSYIRD